MPTPGACKEWVDTKSTAVTDPLLTSPELDPAEGLGLLRTPGGAQSDGGGSPARPAPQNQPTPVRQRSRSHRARAASCVWRDWEGVWGRRHRELQIDRRGHWE